MGRIACMFRNLGGFHAHFDYCSRLLFRRDGGRPWHRLRSPMLITFLGMDPYLAVGIALSSDVLASAVSAYTYGKNKNLDIRNGLIMMASVLAFTVVGSYIASIVPSATMGSFSVVMTFLLGVKFIVRPVMTTKEAMQSVSAKKRAVQSVVCGVIVGFICGFVGLSPAPCPTSPSAERRTGRYLRCAWCLPCCGPASPLCSPTRPSPRP